ncbi:hypothetical protein Pmani_038003 [Petrolisthes manimaculis]|uniref:Uncharacterized protein n=1 Tax=Petrolisthes manimaculis TaxID=1843537 RepID=A0AAE1NH22_9EUCA|nr:hypothetical protein Pmani_038003 [Petrolisthes manimaculis]
MEKTLPSHTFLGPPGDEKFRILLPHSLALFSFFTFFLAKSGMCLTGKACGGAREQEKVEEEWLEAEAKAVHKKFG